MTEIELLRSQLKGLSLYAIMSIFEEEAKRAAKLKIPYTAYLAKLVEEEVLSKTDKSVNIKIRKAKFPSIKTLDAFNFKFQPDINETLIKELAQLGFIDKAENIVFAGVPGTGKTHLAIALGICACSQKKRVLFTNVHALMNDLIACTIDKSINGKLDALSRIDLIIIDELGYLPMNKEAANLFFQLISRRYEKKSIILTTNKAFQEWGDIFGDEIIASAVLDRVLHHCHIFAINGPSYRTNSKIDKKKDQRKALK
jgi:DNA replication protein DnaC